jgi:phosphotransferase system enzyme I (PtsP)
MGGRTLEAMALIGIGIRRLSITPVAVGPLKAMIRSLDSAAAAALMNEVLATPPTNMRSALGDWAAVNQVELG